MSAIEKVPRITIEGRFRRGVSAVFEVVLHGGVRVRQVNERTREICAPEASVYHYALYSEQILNNGWQPFEQWPSAYLPFRYTDLVQKPLPHYGAILMAPRARHGEFHTYDISGDSGRFMHIDLNPDSARHVLREICERVGMDAAETETSVRIIDDHLGQLTLAA